MVLYVSLPLLKNGCVYSSAEVIDNKLFVLGGCDIKGKALKSTQYIDLSNRQGFINFKDLPRAKAGSSITHIDQKLITVGGIYDKQCQLNNVDAYDIGMDSWEELPPVSNPVQGPIVVTRDNVVYCAGGLSTGMSTLSNFEMLDLSVGRWQNLPNMNSLHFNTNGFIYQDTFYVIGGRDGKMSTSFSNCFDFRANAWRNLPKVPDEYRNIFNSCININNHVYLIGGLNEIPTQGFSNLVFRFDLQTEKWEKLPNILKPRADFGAFAVDDKLIIAGGMGNLQGLAATVESFNIPNKKWSLLDDMPTVHASSTQCVADKSMFLVSGMSNTGPSTNVTEIKL